MIQLIDTIKAKLEQDVKNQRGIKAVYWGDPIRIPAANLPAIAVTPSSTTVNSANCSQSEDMHSVSITVIVDGKVEVARVLVERMISCQLKYS